MSERQDRRDRILLPTEPIDRIVGPLASFLHIEAASGGVLLVFTIAALVLANGPLADDFLALWKTPLGFQLGEFGVEHSLKHWINDGLMAVFFFVIGLEVKREIVLGELRDPQRAALPIAAALGGMLAPAAIYLFFQAGQPAQAGWGIPMATDIAFVVGCMAVLGSRVPHGLRVLLLSLAIADDIGAILVIAIGYTETIHWGALGWGIAGIALVSLFARLGVRSFAVYVALGVGVWFAFHESGIHATIAGVVIGLMTPARSYLSEEDFTRMLARASEITRGGDLAAVPDLPGTVRRLQHATREVISPLEYLENLLHPWVGFVIMPLFAFANAGVPFELSDLGHPVAVAVAVALVLGKPIGVVGLSALAVRTGIARLPDGTSWEMMLGGGLLAGIGFTMALFIAGLALGDPSLDAAKVGILAGSTLAAVAGLTVLGRQRRSDFTESA